MSKPSLYHPLIIKHAQEPNHFYKLDHATHIAQGYNPQCGDHLIVYLRCDGHQIKEVSFQGDMCALCKASASMMTSLLQEQEEVSLKDWLMQLSMLLKGEGQEKFAEANVFEVMKDYPTRHKCVLLPWVSVSAALEGKKEATTEE